jgi:hypothetical protein
VKTIIIQVDERYYPSTVLEALELAAAEIAAGVPVGLFWEIREEE